MIRARHPNKSRLQGRFAPGPATAGTGYRRPQLEALAGMIKYFEDVENYLQRHGLPKPKGCAESEIIELEERIGFGLPDSYAAYLRLMGHDRNGVLRGTNCFIEDVEENTEYLPELLAENNVKFDLPEKYLAFFCHQGYMMAWFTLPKESDNPTCYFYNESSTSLPIEQSSFKEFITSEILGMAKITLELRRSRPWWQFWR